MNETETEHVAIATSNVYHLVCFVGCNIPAKFQSHSLIIGRAFLWRLITVLAQPVTKGAFVWDIPE